MTVSGSSSSSHQPHTRTTCVYVRSPALAFYLDFENGPETATVEMIRDAIFASTKFASDATLAKQVFTIWLISARLELQLKPNHRPLTICQSWPALLKRYSNVDNDDFQVRQQPPLLMLQRNLFLNVRTERRIRDETILANLFEEARFNVISGRYPCSEQQLIMLAALQARIELGTFDPVVHTSGYFRDRRSHFLPFAVCNNRTRLFQNQNWFRWPISSPKNSIETRVLDTFRALPGSLTRTKAVRDYMRFCWTMPFYGAAFFKGQLEMAKASWLHSWMFRSDVPVLIAINGNGLYLIDERKAELLLALRYEQLNWDYAEPSMQSVNYNDRYCLPCLFVQFEFEVGVKNVPVDNDELMNRSQQPQPKRVLKFLQIFSKQAKLMDLLIANFVHIWKNGRAFGSAGGATDECDNFEPENWRRRSDEILLDYYSCDNQDNNCNLNITENDDNDCLTATSHDSVHIPGYKYENQLEKLALTTFNEHGQCVDKMGTWSFL